LGRVLLLHGDVPDPYEKTAPTHTHYEQSYGLLCHHRALHFPPITTISKQKLNVTTYLEAWLRNSFSISKALHFSILPSSRLTRFFLSSDIFLVTFLEVFRDLEQDITLQWKNICTSATCIT
jgi:hypothetical protein